MPFAYLTTAEARAFLPADTTLTDAEIDEMVLLASETAEDCTSQVFLPLIEARVFDGTGKSVLPTRRPIQSVSRIEVLACGSGTDYEIDISAVRIGGSRTMLSLGNTLSFSQGGMFGSRYRSNLCSSGGGACGAFPPGFQNIRVTGSWGRFAEVPRSIKRAIGQLLRYTGVCDDPLAASATPYKSESVTGDRSYTMRDIWASTKVNAMTGFADVDAIFARYKAAPTVGWV